MDTNKVSLSGLAVTQPIMTKPAAKTAFAYFTLQVNEQYNDAGGMPKVRCNLFRVEAFGRAAENMMQKVQAGLRFCVDGYLRHDTRDDHDEVKVRVFTLAREDSGDGAVYMQGIMQALDILEKSRDIDTAKEKLRSLVAAK